MKDSEFIVKSRKFLTNGVFEMVLSGDASAMSRPGQFVDVMLPGKFLRRPFAAASWTEDSLTLLCKVVGQGTAELGRIPEGTSLQVLTGLGRGFSMPTEVDAPLLVGGGMGVAPLFALAKELGGKCNCVFGFNTSSDIFYMDEFTALGCTVHIATLDGSEGVKGFVTDAVSEEMIAFDRFYACGPMPMLRAFCSSTSAPGQVSLEARMGCGAGLCMGCTVETAHGPARVCKEGPVFDKEELTW